MIIIIIIKIIILTIGEFLHEIFKDMESIVEEVNKRKEGEVRGE